MWSSVEEDRQTAEIKLVCNAKVIMYMSKGEKAEYYVRKKSITFGVEINAIRNHKRVYIAYHHKGITD